MRMVLFFVFWLLTIITSGLSQLEKIVTGVVEGPMCQAAAICAGSFFILGTGWGGDDTALDVVRRNSHLKACVVDLAKRRTERGMKTSNVQFLSQLLSHDE